MGIIFGMLFLGWGDVLKPNQGVTESIGFYSSGCLSGAETLPLEGPGFQGMRRSRNRFYGQPSTLKFIENLGAALLEHHSGVLVGDISQPRGGPMTNGHASHQIGLDVDFWFWTHPEQNTRSLTTEERETLPFITMLTPDGKVDLTKFTQEQILKLKLAATSPGVERIFVAPAIKKYLCTTIPDSESAWLHPLRPLAGHDEHFHVRLACPKESKHCVTQAAVPPGNGCNEVDEKPGIAPQETPLTFPVQCDAVLKDPSTKD